MNNFWRLLKHKINIYKSRLIYINSISGLNHGIWEEWLNWPVFLSVFLVQDPPYTSTNISIVYLSIHIPIFLAIHLSMNIPTSFYLFINLPIYLAVYLSIDLSIYLASYISIYTSTNISSCLSIYTSTNLSSYLYIHNQYTFAIFLFIPLPIYLSIHRSVINAVWTYLFRVGVIAWLIGTLVSLCGI